MEFEPPFPFASTSSRAEAYLYVLPCHGEDLLKLGFSRDPLTRMQSLHRRYFEFFDTGQAFAVQTETVREARALETRLHRALRLHNAPAPLTVAAAAGGHGEWYRGAYAALAAEAETLADAGHPLHRPLRGWIRSRLLAGADALHAWCALLDPLQLEARGAASRATPAQRRVADVLDAYSAEGLELSRWLQPDVLAWHRAATLRSVSA